MASFARAFRILSGVVVLILCVSSLSFAQARGGFEFGVSQDRQQGSFRCVCGSSFSGGSGTGWNLNAFWEFQLTRDFCSGVKVGFDRKDTRTSSAQYPGLVIVENQQGQTDTTSLPISNFYTFSESFLRIQPYLQNYLFHSHLFLQVGLGAAVLVSNSSAEGRQLMGTAFTFTNGSKSESVQNGSNSTLNTWQFSTLASAGYDLSLFGATIAPMVTIELPLTNVSSEYSNNWKISSIYGSIKFSFAP